MAQITTPRGTRDVLPGEVERWQWVEQVFRQVAGSYGYRELRTPIFEHTELFTRGIGQGTDIVEKEMYTFVDKGNRSLTLRPEGTAPVVRAFLEHRMYGNPEPSKLYYIGPMFRYERPQTGRYRQFHQFGAELLGVGEPLGDVELILMVMDFYRALGLQDCTLVINSIGCPECRAEYIQKLLAFLADKLDLFCADCQRRYEQNPLRVLDCKEASCKEQLATAPLLKDYLCQECKDHFQEVLTGLDDLGEPYRINPYLVRGFDYYTRTVFEITSSLLGSQDALGGGGRYDRLVEESGGPSTPAVGFAAGMERVLLALEKSQGEQEAPSTCQVYLVVSGEPVRRAAMRTLFYLRRHGVATEMSYGPRGMKGQFKSANRLGARFVVVYGEAEYQQGQVILKDMQTGQETLVAEAQLLEELQQRL